MRTFAYERATSLAQAAERASEPGAMLYAGGTTMLDLIKLGVYRPQRVIDITFLEDPALRTIEVAGGTLRLGALVKMNQAAEDATVKDRAPVLSESLWLAATQQLRHMATLGGNVMQRTRDTYFRHPDWLDLADGDAAEVETYGNTPYGDGRLTTVRQPTRLSAVLGTTETDTASYPGDFAQGLVAFDAVIEITGPDGAREMPFADLHVRPADKANEGDYARLAPGEVITAFRVPLSPALARSTYVKARDRASYAFANASAAVGLEMDGDAVADVRIGLGGVATVPWRAAAAEDVLRGGPLTEETMRAAAEAAFADAVTHEANAFKVPLGRNVIVQALTTLTRMEG
ncbi:FAD binding domain-containing protein [Jannaschia aquimarina]|uniref:HcrB_2 protein n=1 Tax=Jannaschia aquimarina TaxID=935700 RepID=A0A0D1EBY9_9RHOB|nr:xanthine dehydrogenase family protein subunit M [Jannaschia aquimarina]KIT14386.1 4-hydroxybenzoyl-CoA reductase subunit beta [Jannaschia aquimarina]SNT42594.1 xanthine dehydrogenase YagS FAD-binding subunit [Jannaschia aquimarina]